MHEEARRQVVTPAEHQMQVIRSKADQGIEGGDQGFRRHTVIIINEQEALLVPSLQIVQ
ncbi:hypothetical protein D3C85_1667930 [compost metagenome]